MLLRKD